MIYDAQLALMTESQCLLMLMISNHVMDQIGQTLPAPADSAKPSARLVVTTHAQAHGEISSARSGRI